MSSLWDDVSQEKEFIPISPVDYRCYVLTNLLYEVIDNRDKMRKALKEGRLVDQSNDIVAVKKHMATIRQDEQVMAMYRAFCKAGVETELDLVYFNMYYRRLLRAGLERSFIGRTIEDNLILTEYNNHDVDRAIISTMRLLRIICAFLGIASTTDSAVFHLDKLNSPAFWGSMSEKFIPLLGEKRISILDGALPKDPTLQDWAMARGYVKIAQSQVLMFLQVVFMTWSGTALVLEGDNIRVTPNISILRLLPQLLK
jgi:hypothetical protein